MTQSATAPRLSTLPRRGLLQGAGLAAAAPLLAAGTAPQRAAAAPVNRPNILLIFADDLGVGDLGCYGSSLIDTPNIDALAAAGVRFADAYSASPVCSPSRAALLTGRYPPRAGVPEVLYPRDTKGLPGTEVTMAEYLRSAGYRTGIFGKWHLGSQPEQRPLRHGFETFYGFLYSHDMKPLQLYRNERIIDPVVDAADFPSLTRRTTDEAISFLRGTGDEPFFAYVPYSMPHIPLAVEPDVAGQSAAGRYGDTVQVIDQQIGRLLRELDKTGKANSTLVLFSSDNGPWYEGDTQGRRAFKGSTFDGGVRTPLIARWTGTVPAGVIAAEPVSLVDLLPTVAELAGVALRPDVVIDGVSLARRLRGAGAVQRGPIYLYDARRRAGQLNAVRSGRWKLHISGDGASVERPYLFDLQRDPEESYDVASRHPDVVARLRKEMLAFDAALQAGRPRS